MRGRMKGVAAALIALGVGAVLGLGMALAVTTVAQFKTSTELYLADLETINLLYKSRNVQEYMKTGLEYIIAGYLEEGGPKFCGEISIIGRRNVSVLKSGECDMEITNGLILNESGRLAGLEAKKYEGEWRMRASSSGEKFCLEQESQLSFGPYSGKVCFNSTIQNEMKEVLEAIKIAYVLRDECRCEGEYKICWTTLGVLGGNYDFTFAVEENC